MIRQCLSNKYENAIVSKSKIFWSKALFSSETFLDFDTVAFLFLFDKYYPIMD